MRFPNRRPLGMHATVSMPSAADTNMEPLIKPVHHESKAATLVQQPWWCFGFRQKMGELQAWPSATWCSLLPTSNQGDQLSVTMTMAPPLGEALESPHQVKTPSGVFCQHRRLRSHWAHPGAQGQGWPPVRTRQYQLTHYQLHVTPLLWVQLWALWHDSGGQPVPAEWGWTETVWKLPYMLRWLELI